MMCFIEDQSQQWCFVSWPVHAEFDDGLGVCTWQHICQQETLCSLHDGQKDCCRHTFLAPWCCTGHQLQQKTKATMLATRHLPISTGTLTVRTTQIHHKSYQRKQHYCYYYFYNKKVVKIKRPAFPHTRKSIIKTTAATNPTKKGRKKRKKETRQQQMLDTQTLINKWINVHHSRQKTCNFYFQTWQWPWNKVKVSKSSMNESLKEVWT